MEIFLTILVGALAGLVGAVVMNLFMRWVTTQLGKRADMIRALGSFFTGSLENARQLGNLIHCFSGVLFGIVYYLIMYAIDLQALPWSLFLGLGFGFLHGLLMSYVLMIFASERHPLEEYRSATLEEGAIHLIGHMIFGAVAGLVAGLVALPLELL
jgi:hypothetical protein